jgi:hypothetical protein
MRVMFAKMPKTATEQDRRLPLAWDCVKRLPGEVKFSVKNSNHMLEPGTAWRFMPRCRTAFTAARAFVG